jgi:hypothetical protein
MLRVMLIVLALAAASTLGALIGGGIVFMLRTAL